MASGVRTNAVKGDFSPVEAIDRMLAGTGLVAAQDDKAGTFTINRVSNPDPQSDSNAKKKTP